MAESDLDLVRAWRNSDRIRSVSYTDHVISPEEHRRWFARVTTSSATAPLVFECEGRAVGVVNLVDIDGDAGSCAWGFYIGAEDAPRGAGAALGFCALEHVFETMGLRTLRGEALAGNEASVRFHLRLGFERTGRIAGHAEKDGEAVDVLVFELEAETWNAGRTALHEMTFGDPPPATL
jgi:UDP-4-amino-4,6-dideoxy-N-acetyl-beta-L-altrosamine N-acetyltransferase